MCRFHDPISCSLPYRSSRPAMYFVGNPSIRCNLLAGPAMIENHNSAALYDFLRLTHQAPE